MYLIENRIHYKMPFYKIIFIHLFIHLFFNLPVCPSVDTEEYLLLGLLNGDGGYF